MNSTEENKTSDKPQEQAGLAAPTGYTASTPKNHLSLKWGTLKGWNIAGNDEMIKLMKRYEEIGASYSAMTQRDTPEQKEIICNLIDLMPGEIYLWWDGIYVSKEAAKKYVLEYGKDKPCNIPS